MRKKKESEVESTPLIREETKHSIVAIVCFALAGFFLLSAVGQAGLAGSTTYNTLKDLFGLGFFLVPIVLILLAVSFLKSVKPDNIIKRLLAGLVVFLAFLPLLSIVLSGNDEITRNNGGIVGQIVAEPLYRLFAGYSLIFFTAIILIALLVMLDKHLAWPVLITNAWARFRHRSDPNLAVTEPMPLDLQPIPNITSAPVPEPTTRPEEADDSEKKIFSGLTGLINTNRRASANFTPPPLSLLRPDSGKPAAGDIKGNANIIKRTLANFGIIVEMDEVSIGPSITRYALKPAEGVKLSRIIALQNDLSLALAAHPLRIEAPIPGKSLVGIEIPNSTKSTVGLASLVGSADFKDSPHPLFVSLGRSIAGSSHFSNLAKAPHILIAGATGSGKSVVIHTFLVSLLYRNPPDRLRLILIDPKRVELTPYNNIPHLLTPVVTDAKKAILVLKWAIKEMERRYAMLEAHSVRDIQSYQANIADSSETAEKMPYIVVVIDELADIMSTYPRELEAAIVRLAQMSRAVGIHLVLSTQRPSVEVITGLIKANIPARVALQVASQIDSRTILDMAGAEKLLGAGDMLYLAADMSKPVRLQSAFISEDEVKKVVKHLTAQMTEENAEDIVLTNPDASGGSGISLEEEDNLGDDDDLYEDAREVVMETGKASASFLQRKLRVGYSRAARLIDMMEERGVVGPASGARGREVYERNTPQENNF